MRLAAEELEASDDLVTVIDSANLSTGIGLLVIEAAIMAQEGKTARRDHSSNRRAEAKSTRKFCGGYAGISLFVAGAAMLFLPWREVF